MLLSGQQLLIANAAPQKARKILWYYDWATIGDAIMDLSQRFLIDPRVSIDLCMPYGPIELFVGDDRFRRAFRSLDDCDARYDMVIVQSLTTKTIFKKLQYHPFTPWLAIMAHERGERFSRIQLAYEQIARVFKSRESGPIEPALTIPDQGAERSQRFTISVAVGGGDKRRRYENWAEVIRLILSSWPKEVQSPKFILIGTGDTAIDTEKAVRDNLDCDHVESHMNLPSIAVAAQLIQRSSFFIGADGGLMHIAAALGKPGVAIFCEIKPEWRLHSKSKMRPVFSAQDINSIPVARVASEVADYCRELAQAVT
ncbi:glycosyl transferase family 9 (putative heptosyltransferase) [Paraburkholderia sp. BL23I1N1]|uniref:glycosyltransferase family 9 protein n=1 Tax=Paraburkholderia sp. BL23I1N1 TaxID=1938802 RepID=UPI000FF2A4FD|nr:glycosyltransferase family 9 protein [Paraburkholderia sp. BL23I1N1]RKE26239.1 glycosyl transferase family 9 (putative heptosyltransferase) [Paraburkholderia sp. BL23I1N1]